MKRIVLFLLAAVALVSCDDKPKNQVWDPNAMVSLRPAAGVKAETNPEHLSAKEIVETAVILTFYNKLFQEEFLSRTFDPVQRDLVNIRLLMFGTDIISQEGLYETGFIKGEDMVVTQGRNADTIAYIPNAVLRAADVAIKSAYDAGEYEMCYALFDQAFTFQPITGAEWRELKAQGKN